MKGGKLSSLLCSTIDYNSKKKFGKITVCQIGSTSNPFIWPASVVKGFRIRILQSG
jgi:hypothetical protein